MVTIGIPGYKTLELNHLVLDYNGTMALDGRLLEGIRERLEELSEVIKIHVLTADTFGSVDEELEGVPCELFILPDKNQDIGKRDYINRLGPESVVSIGNGRNDSLMLKASELGLAVTQDEGTAAETLAAADVVVPDIISALDLLIHPRRLIATLRT